MVKATLKLDKWRLYRGYMLLKKKTLVVVTVLCIASTALAVLSARGDDDYFKVVLAFFGTLWVLYVLVQFILPIFVCRAWMKEPGLEGQNELTADDTGIMAKNPQMETNYQWSGFTTYAESRGLFALKVGKRMLMVVPKDSFESEADVEGFRDLLRRNIATDRKG